MGVLTAAPSSLSAQLGATVDQASIAREAYKSALLVGTREEALPLLRRAAHAWPTPPAYWIALARVAVSPSLGDAWTTLTQAVEPRRLGRVIATIPDSTMLAEGIDADVTTGMFAFLMVR